MKRYKVVSILLAVVVFTPLALAQRPEEHGMAPWEEQERGIELRHRELELESLEAQLAFEAQMRELELEARRADMEREFSQASGNEDGTAIFILFWFVINILLTIWVYQDLQKRGGGSGIWIAVTLIAGIPGVLVYAVVRLGDNRPETP